MRRARAKFVVMTRDEDSVTIADLSNNGPFVSVTNDAENVVGELIDGGTLSEYQRLFYYDTQGELSELVHHDGMFLGFKPIEVKP